MAMSAILFFIIGSTVHMHSVVSVGIHPRAANSPCLNGSGYNETQLSLLINTITDSQPAAVQLFPEPVDGRIIPGEEAAFLCCAIVYGAGWSSGADWMINPQPSSNMNLFDRGSTKYVTPVTMDSTLTLTLIYRTMRVNGSLDVNGTEIKCYVANGGHHKSEPKELIVMGPPPTPVPSLEFIAINSVKVRWDPVFTWPDYPIIGYNLTVVDSARQILISRQTLSNEANISLDDLGLENCEELVFTVVASNSLGRSQPGAVSGGFPNPLVLSEFGSTIDVSVLYTSDLEPRVQLTITLPSLCPYQMLRYTVVLEGLFNNTQQMLHINGEVDLNVDDEINMDISPTLGLALQESYDVYATLYSDSGQNVTTDAYSFNTQSVVVPDCKRGSDSTTLPICNHNSGNDVILYCLGALCVLFFSTLVVTLCGLCTCWIKKKRFHSSSRSGIRSGMITNPIYDSPIYDIIKDEKGKLISSSAAASPLSDGFPEFPQATIDDSKLVDFPLEPQAANAKQALEPRYSSTSNSENSESVYVKMKGKVNSTHDGSTLEPGDDKKLRLGQVTMV